MCFRVIITIAMSIRQLSATAALLGSFSVYHACVFGATPAVKQPPLVMDAAGLGQPAEILVDR